MAHMWNADHTDPDTYQRQCERRYVVLDHDGVPTLYPDTLAGAARRARDEALGVLLAVAFVLVVFALAIVAS